MTGETDRRSVSLAVEEEVGLQGTKYSKYHRSAFVWCSEFDVLLGHGSQGCRALALMLASSSSGSFDISLKSGGFGNWCEK